MDPLTKNGLAMEFRNPSLFGMSNRVWGLIW